MAEETKDWVEIDLSEDQLKEAAKVQENISSTEEETKPVDPPEVDGIETNGAQKRIRQLVQERNQAMAVVEAYRQEQEKIRKENDELKASRVEEQKSVFDHQESQIAQKLVHLKNQIVIAYRDGEIENAADLQEQMADAKAEQKLLQLAKAQHSRKPPEKTVDEIPQPKNQQISLDEKQENWFEKNKSWFGKDVELTDAAMAMDLVLKSRGVDPKSDDYYKAIDSHMSKLGVKNQVDRPNQVVSGASRTPAIVKGKVRLTQDELAMAKRLGIDPATYGLQKDRPKEGGYRSIL